ncbi:MAG: MFS transporter permease [Deltaproteobacteria bacterium]|nr:MFS transporter permease [Deltaproteobacteria bacterium]
MGKKRKERIIPREQAVFGLDARGHWQHVEQGRFENPRIIAYFHSCIRKDEHGYHLVQDHAGIREKVYFPCEDTALFVFDVIKGDDVVLVLNTGRREPLRPRKLFIRDDVLYTRLGEHRVRFTENALVRMADLLEFDGDESTFVRVRGRRYRIPEEPREPAP